jgi:hypothetical protein
VDEIIITDNEGIEAIRGFGWNDSIDMADFTFDGTNVVFSLVKTESGQIEDFIDKCVAI